MATIQRFEDLDVGRMVRDLISQLYRCFANNDISKVHFEERYRDADILTKELTAFISYLNKYNIKGQKF